MHTESPGKSFPQTFLNNIFTTVLSDVVDAYAVKIASGKYSCKVCGFVTRDKYNIRWHLEGKHELGAGYQCEKCKEVVKTKKHLTQHRLHCGQNRYL